MASRAVIGPASGRTRGIAMDGVVVSSQTRKRIAAALQPATSSNLEQGKAEIVGAAGG